MIGAVQKTETFTGRQFAHVHDCLGYGPQRSGTRRLESHLAEGGTSERVEAVHVAGVVQT